VYGLAADAGNPAAVREVFRAKNRPTDHPLIVHVAEVSDVADWIADLPQWADQLLAAYAPGPLTVVGRRTSRVSDIITGGQDTVAVRIPSHPLAHALLTAASRRGVTGLVAPSANRFGQVSPTTADHVVADLGPYLATHDGLVLDGGACDVGIESTIVLTTGQAPVILRPGSVTAKMVTEATGLAIETAANVPRVSGTMASHYAPAATVVLAESVDQATTGSGLIAYAELPTPPGVVRVASPIDAADFARQLYQGLRDADARGLAKVYVVAPTDGGIADAVRDRLQRAARTMSP
jgi:L-threonylcarbamoyladenylate synthase